MRSAVPHILRALSSRDRQLGVAFLILAAVSGVVSFFAGQGVVALVTTPRYRPTLPMARTVDQALWTARLAHRPAPSGNPQDIPPTAADIVETTERGNWIRIPALSLSVPLVAAATIEDREVLRALQVGVVRYPNGVEPGQPGVVVIAGHSTGEPWKGRYRFTFLRTGNLQHGDVISVDHNGTRYTYRVTGQRLMNPRHTPFLESSAETPRLAIVTCWPLWTTQQRLVIEAELSGTARLAFRPSSDS